ncbi:MAG: 4Fe-4S dicluster domain-containing protein [Bacteroidales bacterium]|nr:4Fe-4S dicluster domain-containing protein [Bacteroidales bacterium]
MTDDLTGKYVDLGLYQGQELLVLDLEKCTRCDECVKACADSHGGVTRVVRDGPRFGHFLVAISCRSCHDPYCLTGCPVDAIHREGRTLEIQIDDHCIGCGLCAHNCPYGSIHMVQHDERGHIHEIPRNAWPSREEAEASGEAGRHGADGPVRKARLMAVNCDLCTSSLSGPRCVYACPHDAAHRLPGERVLELATLRRVPLEEDSILARLRRMLWGNPTGE